MLTFAYLIIRIVWSLAFVGENGLQRNSLFTKHVQSMDRPTPIARSTRRTLKHILFCQVILTNAADQKLALIHGSWGKCPTCPAFSLGLNGRYFPLSSIVECLGLCECSKFIGGGKLIEGKVLFRRTIVQEIYVISHVTSEFLIGHISEIVDLYLVLTFTFTSLSK